VNLPLLCKMDIFACHLQIDPDPVYHFDADADPDPEHCLKALTDHLGGGSRVDSFDPQW
jgi:hypothetical protein